MSKLKYLSRSVSNDHKLKHKVVPLPKNTSSAIAEAASEEDDDEDDQQ